MKSIRICFILAAWGCTLPALAQQTFASSKYTAMCNYYGEVSTKALTLYPASQSAEKVVQDIMSVIGLRANFELRSANVPTAAAVIKQGKRFILYNPRFMNNIISATGSKWAAVSILAHEIGHHLNGHTLDNESSKPKTELEADEFSGFVLQKMGASLTDAQAAMGAIASLKGSHTHPPKNQRLNSIATGWTKAGGQINNPVIASYPQEEQKQVSRPAITIVTSQPKPLSRAEKIAQSATYNKNVASEAYFASDPNGRYYVTTRGNLVQVDRDKVYLITAYNNIYIGSGGMLVNNYGKKVGYLKSRK